jgi:hypothetical protein
LRWRRNRTGGDDSFTKTHVLTARGYGTAIGELGARKAGIDAEPGESRQGVVGCDALLDALQPSREAAEVCDWTCALRPHKARGFPNGCEQGRGADQGF